MPILLFRLNGVPDDEADEVRELLSRHHVDFYETSAGRFGISLAAIWLRDDSDFTRAQQLIDDYQVERTQRVRSEYAALCRAGRNETFLDRLRRHPVRFVGYAAVILFILWFTLAPFFP